MRSSTAGLIDLTADLGGRFFLPYQLHYTAAQLRRVLSRDRRCLRGQAPDRPGQSRLTSTFYERFGRK